jgi:hypothetical protein
MHILKVLGRGRVMVIDNMNLAALNSLIASSESERLELGRSIGRNYESPNEGLCAAR